jgi:hypothetical protein
MLHWQNEKHRSYGTIEEMRVRGYDLAEASKALNHATSYDMKAVQEYLLANPMLIYVLSEYNKPLIFQGVGFAGSMDLVELCALLDPNSLRRTKTSLWSAVPLQDALYEKLYMGDMLRVSIDYERHNKACIRSLVALCPKCLEDENEDNQTPLQYWMDAFNGEQPPSYLNYITALLTPKADTFEAKGPK